MKTSAVRTICLRIVKVHLKYEESLFDAMWEAFWTTVGCTELYELPARFRGLKGTSAITKIGAVAPAEMAFDSLYVIAAMSQAGALLMMRESPPSVDDVRATIETVCSRITVPAHIISILQKHGAALLAAQLEASALGGVATESVVREPAFVRHDAWEKVVPSEGTAQTKKDDRQKVVVECCDLRADYYKPEESARSVVVSGYKRQDYVLYVDEADEHGIYVRQRLVAWAKLKRSHLYCLGEILVAHRHKSVLSYNSVGVTCCDIINEQRGDLESGGKRVYQELNRILRGVFKNHIRAERKAGYYVIDRRVKYCWIREKNEKSRLLRYQR